MATRRIGGMSGGPRGNRSYNQQFQGGGVNPWQGSNNSMNQGLLSQISNPQQLALALTSLLQPQQQSPPSLLSLNTSPGFSNQDRDFNRFGNRGRDFRRHEPYNKNRNQGGLNRNRRLSQSKKKDDSRVKDEPKDEHSADEGNEEGDNKRDWKDEKNTNEDRKDETEEEAKLRKEKEEKDGPYYDVPVKLLNCFVCNKEMWDGESMRKHVKGRAHRQMLDSLEESIHITVNILRENMRLQEEKKLIELNRVQRVTKRFNKPEPESHCNMCDLKFLGKIIAHRKTDGHQRLKHYLHPNCRLCSKEFPSRMEWIEHRLTPEHLRKLNKSLNDKIGGIDGCEIVNELELEPLLDEPLEMEAENPILELTDNLNGLQNLMPAYKPTRAVATECLKPFSGFVCEICYRSFTDEELAQKHLKTKRHHSKFIEILKLRYKEQQKKEREEKEAEEKRKLEAEKNGANEEGDMYDPDEPTQEESSALEAETTMETSQDDCGDPSMISLTTDPLETEEDESLVKEEPESAVSDASIPTASPVKQTRAATTAATAGVAATATSGAVKNGAGPKCKKMRK